jgi:hypothetical protein
VHETCSSTHSLLREYNRRKSRGSTYFSRNYLTLKMKAVSSTETLEFYNPLTQRYTYTEWRRITPLEKPQKSKKMIYVYLLYSHTGKGIVLMCEKAHAWMNMHTNVALCVTQRGFLNCLSCWVSETNCSPCFVHLPTVMQIRLQHIVSVTRFTHT